MYECKLCKGNNPYRAGNKEKLRSHICSHLGEIDEDVFLGNFSRWFVRLEKCSNKAKKKKEDFILGYKNNIKINLFTDKYLTVRSARPIFDNWHTLNRALNCLRINVSNVYYRIKKNGEIIYPSNEIIDGNEYLDILSIFFFKYVKVYGISFLLKRADENNRHAEIKTLLRQTAIWYTEHLNYIDEVSPYSKKPYVYIMLYVYKAIEANIEVQNIASSIGTKYKQISEMSGNIDVEIFLEFLDWLEHCPSTSHLYYHTGFLEKLITRFNKISRKEIDDPDFLTVEYFYNKIPAKLISWDNVEFQDDRFVIEYQEKPKSKKKKMTLVFEGVKKTFYHLKPYFAKKSKGLLFKIENGRYKSILNIKEVRDFVKYLEVEEVEVPDLRREFTNALPSRCIRGKKEIKKLMLLYRSRSLSFLAERHVETYPLYCVQEFRFYDYCKRYEDAFIFVIQEHQNILKLAYENVFEKNATYLFRLEKKNYENVVKIINRYFSSSQINKRENLYKLREMLKDNIISMKRISHGSWSWDYNIQHY